MPATEPAKLVPVNATKSRRGRPPKTKDAEAMPMEPAPTVLGQKESPRSVELQQIHLHGGVFVHGNMATQLTRGKNNVTEMRLYLASGLVRLQFSASDANKAATVYLPSERWTQVTER